MTATTLSPSVPDRRSPSARRRRPRPRPPVAPDWTCENCAEPNAGRRRRCTDCGTSRW